MLSFVRCCVSDLPLAVLCGKSGSWANEEDQKEKKNRQTPKGYLGDLLLCVNAHNIFKENSLSLKLFLNLVMSSVYFSIHFFVNF